MTIRMVTGLLTCWILRPKPRPERREGEQEGEQERSWAWLRPVVRPGETVRPLELSNLARRQDWLNWVAASLPLPSHESPRLLGGSWSWEAHSGPADLTAHEGHGTWWRLQTSGDDNNLGDQLTSHLAPQTALFPAILLVCHLSSDKSSAFSNQQSILQWLSRYSSPFCPPPTLRII